MFRKWGMMLAAIGLSVYLLLPFTSATADGPAAAEETTGVELTIPSGLVDDLSDFSKTFQRSNMYTEKGNPAYYGDDAGRAARSTTNTGYVLYKTDYDMTSFAAYSYFYAGVAIVGHKIYASTDGAAYTEVTANVYTSGDPVSNWQLYVYEGLQLPAGTHYLKIEFAGSEKSWTPQLAKVVINQSTVSVQASPETGVIGTEPLAVSLQTPTVGAAVYYRINGSPSFQTYTQPLALTGFTRLDAYAQLDGLQPSPIRSYTYFSQGDMQIDRYGQVINASFPAKVTSDQQLRDDIAADQAYYGKLKPPAAFDPIGGLTDSRMKLKLKATGFFSVQQVKGKPQLVTPQGDLFFSLGVNGVTNNETYTKVTGSIDRQKIFEWVPDYNSEYNGAFIGSKDNFSYYMANKYRKAGTMPTFNDFFAEAAGRMKKWGFNSIGAWSPTPQAKASGLPYTLVLPLNGMAKPSEVKVFDIFADGAVQAIDDAFAKSLPALKDDPNLIGYFVDNEYAYEKFIATVPRLKAATSGLKQRLVQMLQEKYGDIAAFNSSWGTSFAGFTDLNETPLYIDTQQASDDVDQFFHLYLDTYYKTVKQLFEKYDPNHLLLGDRWLTLPMQSTKIRGILAEEAGKYMDVISINHYSPNLDVAMLKDVYEKSGHRPILLSEWSYGTAEQGLAPIVLGPNASEQDRGWRYRNYVEGAAALGFVVGAHWFDYVDQAAGGRYFQDIGGEHYNTGLVNVADRPYKTFLDAVMKTNRGIYDVVLGKKQPFRHDFGDDTGGGTGKNLQIEIPYTPVPIPIDGVLNGYSCDTGAAVLDAGSLVSGTGGEGISSSFHFAWDENNLYLTASVTEPTPMMNSYQNSNLWKGDGIELFTGPDDLELAGSLQFSDRQIIMSSAIVNDANYWMWFNTGHQPAVTMNVQPAQDGQGYVLDAAIPWSAIHISPADGEQFLFDFGFDDSEDGVNRLRQWIWNGTNKDNVDRGLWGLAKLTGGPAE
ncbi:sugar-binding protein [Paenibacillus humicola]|uniref:sugar-binding protein n=1 Tax=Paenibacillus humicola TaxID=3110540 RepID=UPI00237B0920|nr:sugar-binding protein [Paenibacillus humicola]